MPSNVTFENVAHTRRCPGCRNVYPATREFFYTYPNGRLERCNQNGSDCHARYYRLRAEARRSGRATPRVVRGPRFGVEIEFVGASNRDVADALTRAGLRCVNESYNHSTRSYWKVTTDASVNNGGELVSPPLSGPEGLEQVRIACRALQSVGAHPSASTGLHVHHEMSGQTVESFGRAFNTWMMNQDNIDALVARSRRASQWCRRLTASEVRVISDTIRAYGMGNHTRTRFRIDRYKSLNVASYPKYGTVEIRQHQGTVNAKKIVAWIEFGQAFFKTALQCEESLQFADINDMLDHLVEHGGLDERTATYLKERAVSLAGEQAPAVHTTDPDHEICACGAMLDADGCCSHAFAAVGAA